MKKSNIKHEWWMYPYPERCKFIRDCPKRVAHCGQEAAMGKCLYQPKFQKECIQYIQLECIQLEMKKSWNPSRR